MADATPTSRMVYEYYFLIPVQRVKGTNDITEQSADNLMWLQTEIYLLSPDGGQKEPGFVSGWYRNKATNRLDFDECIRFRLALDGPGYDSLCELLGRACEVFEQESIYLCECGRPQLISHPMS